MTTPRADQNAAAAYAAHRAEIARLLDVLDMELERHGQAAKADPGHWGRAGDLAEVRRDLINVVAFLSGMERERIEGFLAEAE